MNVDELWNTVGKLEMLLCIKKILKRMGLNTNTCNICVPEKCSPLLLYSVNLSVPIITNSQPKVTHSLWSL